MEQVENRMVVDSLWEQPTELGSGWYSCWEPRFVADEEALDFALDRLSEDEDTKEEFIEEMVEYIFTHKEVQKRFKDWFFRRWERMEA